jgi:phosphoglycolate phosphatase
MMKADLLLFDIDGTLVDSRQDITTSVNLMLKDLGLEELGFDEVVSFIGSGLGSLITRSMGPGNEPFFEKAVERFEYHYSRHITDTSTLYPGTKSVLEHFKDRKMYVITNRNKDLADMSLKHLKIRDYFLDVFGGDEKEQIKPSPYSINRVLDLTGLDKNKSIIIGDMDVDILAGKNAGIKTCAVTYGLGTREDLSKANPDYMIDSLLELENIIS